MASFRAAFFPRPERPRGAFAFFFLRRVAIDRWAWGLYRAAPMQFKFTCAVGLVMLLTTGCDSGAEANPTPEPAADAAVRKKPTEVEKEVLSAVVDAQDPHRQRTQGACGSNMLERGLRRVLCEGRGVQGELLGRRLPPLLRRRGADCRFTCSGGGCTQACEPRLQLSPDLQRRRLHALVRRRQDVLQDMLGSGLLRLNSSSLADVRRIQGALQGGPRQ